MRLFTAHRISLEDWAASCGIHLASTPSVPAAPENASTSVKFSKKAFLENEVLGASVLAALPLFSTKLSLEALAFGIAGLLQESPETLRDLLIRLANQHGIDFSPKGWQLPSPSEGEILDLSWRSIQNHERYWENRFDRFLDDQASRARSPLATQKERTAEGRPQPALLFGEPVLLTPSEAKRLGRELRHCLVRALSKCNSPSSEARELYWFGARVLPAKRLPSRRS